MDIKKIKEDKRVQALKEKTITQRQEFLDFLKLNNISQLTIGVILGSAGKDLVTSLSTNIVMPLVGLLTPSGSWREIALTVGKTQFKIGEAMSSILDFAVILLLVFIVIKKVLKVETDVKKEFSK